MTDQPHGEGVSFDKQQPWGGYEAGAGAPFAGYPSYPPMGYGYGGYPAAPGYGYQPGPPPGPKPSNNIGWSIAAIFLFWPLCIPSFIFGSRVDPAWFAGDYYGAQKASDDAKKYGMIGVIIGASIFALYILFFVVIFGLVLAAA